MEEVKKSRLVTYRDKAKWVAIGTAVASVLFEFGYSSLSQEALRAASMSAMTSTTPSMSPGYLTAASTAATNAQLCLGFFIICATVAGIAAVAWVMANLAIAYKES